MMQVLGDFLNEENIVFDGKLTEETRLFGGDGMLTSIQLVMFITSLEEEIEDEWDVMLTLADEKAMSRRVSPFSSIKYLADYIEEKINEYE